MVKVFSFYYFFLFLMTTKIFDINISERAYAFIIKLSAPISVWQNGFWPRDNSIAGIRYTVFKAQTLTHDSTQADTFIILCNVPNTVFMLNLQAVLNIVSCVSIHPSTWPERVVFSGVQWQRDLIDSMRKNFTPEYLWQNVAFATIA